MADRVNAFRARSSGVSETIWRSDLKPFRVRLRACYGGHASPIGPLTGALTRIWISDMAGRAGLVLHNASARRFPLRRGLPSPLRPSGSSDTSKRLQIATAPSNRRGLACRVQESAAAAAALLRSRLEIRQQVVRSTGETGSDRIAVSCGRDDPQPPLPVGRKGKARPDVLRRQIREVCQNILTDIPPARYSSTSRTVIRSPRMHGCPLRLPGSIVIRCV